MSLFNDIYNVLICRKPAEGERINLALKLMEESKEQALTKLFAPGLEERFELGQFFSTEEEVALDATMTKRLIWNRQAQSLFIIKFDGDSELTKIQFDKEHNPIYHVTTGHVITDFEKIYLTNVAQEGKKLRFVVGFNKDVSYLLTQIKELGELPKKATLPYTYNKVMTLADTEYNYTLPAKCKHFRLSTQDGTAFRFAFTTGKVAGGGSESDPCINVPANLPYELPFGVELAAQTIYFACGTAGKMMEIQAYA